MYKNETWEVRVMCGFILPDAPNKDRKVVQHMTVTVSALMGLFRFLQNKVLGGFIALDFGWFYYSMQSNALDRTKEPYINKTNN